MYNVADFRRNIRKALNEADNGREVIIERYGQRYQLSSLVGEPNSDGAYQSFEHDKKEDDGRIIEVGDEHTVTFEVPPVANE